MFLKTKRMFEIIIADSPKSCRPKISSSKVLYSAKYSQSTQSTIWPAGASSAIISLKFLCFPIAYSNTSNGYTSLFSLAFQTAPKPECTFTAKKKHNLCGSVWFIRCFEWWGFLQKWTFCSPGTISHALALTLLLGGQYVYSC